MYDNWLKIFEIIYGPNISVNNVNQGRFLLKFYNINLIVVFCWSKSPNTTLGSEHEQSMQMPWVYNVVVAFTYRSVLLRNDIMLFWSGHTASAALLFRGVWSLVWMGRRVQEITADVEREWQQTTVQVHHHILLIFFKCKKLVSRWATTHQFSTVVKWSET